MRTILFRKLSWILSAVVFGAGLMLTVGTVRSIRQTGLSMNDQAGRLQTLRQFADEMDRYVSARRRYEKLPGSRAVQLETILRETIDPEKIEEVRESRADIGNGWLRRTKEVILAEMPMQKVMDAIRKAEAQRPPWLLSECVIRAVPLTPGQGRSVLAFDVLERSSAASP